MSKKLSHIGEFGLIDWIQKTAHIGKDVRKGIGDDTAVLPWTATQYLLFTTDMIAEGVHFTSDTSPHLIGRKVLACNISDIAAMGGLPTAAVVSLGVRGNLPVRFVKELYRGIYRLAGIFKVGVVGGDTVKSDKLAINVALLGEVAKSHLLLRSGAGVGDIIFVTGPLGRSFPSKKHLTFIPRVRESQFLVESAKPSAMIDISDGLAGDLGHIVKASRVGAFLYADQIPRNKGATLNEALYGGEDFELLFTLPLPKAKRLKKISARRFSFYPIGQIVEKEQGLQLINAKGRKQRLSTRGFTHF